MSRLQKEVSQAHAGDGLHRYKGGGGGNGHNPKVVLYAAHAGDGQR